jgi:PAS domain S-box-containing protein
MSNARIVIVEDENIIAMDLKTRLLALGHEIVGIAKVGEDAIQLAETFHPDLMLMDIVLRGEMDGIQVAGQVQGRLGIPVIFITAYSDEPTVRRARLTEPYGYVLKPVDDRELQAVIEMTLYKARMERQLRASEAHVRSLTENSTVIITRQSREGIYLYVSPACTRLLGYLPEEMIQRSVFEFVHPADATRLTATDLPATFRMRHKDGTWIRMERPAHAHYDPGTGETWEVQMIWRDVTAHQQSEPAHRHLLAILDAVTDLVCITDPRGYILRLNRAGRDLLHVPSAEDMSQFCFFDFLSAEQVAELQRAGFPNAPSFADWHGELNLVTRHKEEIPVSLVGLVHLSAEGDVEFVSVIARAHSTTVA